MSNFGFIPDVLFLTTTFIFIILFRKKLTKLFTWIKLPLLAVYIISSLPFMIIEENVNCLQTGCVFIPWTIPVLILFVLVLGLITMKSNVTSMKKPLLGFILFGILWEVFIGGLRGQLPVLGPGFYSFMVVWVGVSYAYFVIVPLTLLIEQKKAKSF